MTQGLRNTLWYSFGSASSVVAAASISVIAGQDTGRGYRPSLVVLIWCFYFGFTAVIFGMHRAILIPRAKRLSETAAPFLCLSAGLLYSPVFLSLTTLSSGFGGDENWVILPSAVIPVTVGFGFIVVVRMVRNRTNPATSANAG